jgi:hypothetical protein
MMSRCLAIGLAIGACAASTHAATITEYFNDYGTATANINGKGAADDGWAGAWSSSTSPTSYYAGYTAGSQLTYSAAGYAGAGNDNGADDGLLSAGPGAGVANTSFRAFDTGLTGTIWISLQVNVSADAKDILFLLDASNTNNVIGLRGSTGIASGNTSKVPEPMVKYNSGTDTSDNTTFAAGATHLFLARIGMNASGNADTLDFWVDPILGAAAPTSAALYSKSGADAYGASLDGIGVTFASAGGSIDAIRVSNDVDGYVQVTSVPEPSVVLTLLAGAPMMLLRRSRRKD